MIVRESINSIIYRNTCKTTYNLASMSLQIKCHYFNQIPTTIIIRVFRDSQ